MKSYILVDTFDGRVLRTLRRISSRKLARQFAVKYNYLDAYALIELRAGERIHVQSYTGKYVRGQNSSVCHGCPPPARAARKRMLDMACPRYKR